MKGARATILSKRLAEPSKSQNKFGVICYEKNGETLDRCDRHYNINHSGHR